MRAWCSFAWMLVCGGLAAACLDLSPVPYAGSDSGTLDGSLPGVFLDASPDARAAECQQCLATMCPAQVAACNKNTKCATLAMCLNATLCWGSSLADLTNLSPCLVNCALSAGVVGQDDPASLLGSAVFTCAEDPNVCAGPCGVATDE